MTERRKEIEISVGTKYDEFNQFSPDYSQCDIKYYESKDLQYDYFFKEHMLLNMPCVIRNISDPWQCSEKWVKNERINYDYFIENYGNMDAPVADCDKINFNAQCKVDMKVKDYMSYLSSKNRDKLLYLKDWHLRKISCDNTFYEVPELFASDWLNEYSIDNQEDDFMFVYIGPKNTWTPFHADVYTSYSWSVNIVGRKKWVLLPPGEEEKLKDSLGNIPVLFKPEDYTNVQYFEVIQEKSQGIFVPSGWHHQVFNILDTISINHNFVNACNIEAIWKSLERNLIAVEHEIEEFKDTQEFSFQCQLILKSLFGMDFESFAKFIMHIAQKRLNHMKTDEYLLFNIYNLGKKHIMFDLKVILKIINIMLNHPLFLKKNTLSPDIAPKLLIIKKSIEALKLK